MKRLLSYMLLAAILLTGCSAAQNTENTEKTEATASTGTVAPPAIIQPTQPDPDPIGEYLKTMTLQQKVGQLFIAEAEQLVSKNGAVIAVTEELKDNLTRYPIGGVILFAENVISPEQLLALNSGLQEASGIPLFISTDEEGGRVTRLGKNEAFGLPRYESAAAVGSSGNPEDALAMGRTIGGYLHQYGLNLNFAPVADVNTNPRNPIIGVRAFSSDPVIAGAMAEAFARGSREMGVIPTFKHFPGHGDTAEDSHPGLAVNHKTQEQLQSCEWLTFQKAGSSDMVMVGHVALPQVTGNRMPATLSKEIVTDILKGELGFSGLVITDALNMGAITEHYGAGEAAVAALQAGCDILLMPQDLPAAYHAVLAAVEDGTFSEEWLDETVYRILQFKHEYAILTF